MSLNSYLYFDGQCEEAFQFYEKCLGGKMTWEGASMAGQAPPGWPKKILHAGLAFGDGVLEGCDAMPGEYKKPQSFCVMLRPKDAKEAERIFSARRRTAPYRYRLWRLSGRCGSERSLIDLGRRG